MRTSYRMSHPEEDKEDKLEQNLQEESDKIVDSVIQEVKDTKKNAFIHTYREIENAKYDMNDKEKAQQAVSEVSQEAAEEQEKHIEKKKKSRKKVLVTALAVIGVLAIGLGGVSVYNHFFRQDNSLEAISDRVENLYTSAKKEDIKSGITEGDLNTYYLELNEVSKNGKDVSSVQSELDTIGYFLSDKATLIGYDSEDYDLTTSGLQDSVDSIKENSESYTVPGLAVTISDLCTKITGDYETFIALRSEMQGITDATTFDEEGYKSRIANIHHKPNQEELNAIYDNIVADKQAAEAEQALKDAATQEAQEKAQQALEEAQQTQKETQQKLEEAEKKLQEKAEQASEGVSDIIDGIKGVVSGEDGSESNTENNNSSDISTPEESSETTPETAE